MMMGRIALVGMAAAAMSLVVMTVAMVVILSVGVLVGRERDMMPVVIMLVRMAIVIVRVAMIVSMSVAVIVGMILGMRMRVDMRMVMTMAGVSMTVVMTMVVSMVIVSMVIVSARLVCFFPFSPHIEHEVSREHRPAQPLTNLDPHACSHTRRTSLVGPFRHLQDISIGRMLVEDDSHRGNQSG
jgi:hypothetical protein